MESNPVQVRATSVGCDIWLRLGPTYIYNRKLTFILRLAETVNKMKRKALGGISSWRCVVLSSEIP